MKDPDAIPLYEQRDLEALDEYYYAHVAQMTVYGLNSKSAIAAELAHRDKVIDELEAEVASLRRTIYDTTL